MDGKNGTVSVAMASYNGAGYIREQISGILADIGENSELVISDDGSSDGTEQIIHDFGDARIKLIEGPRRGLVKNFENAVKHCSGDVIFLCDQDDIWYPGKVKTVLEALSEPGVLLVQHDARVVDDSGNVLFPSFAAHRRVRTGLLKNMLRNCYHGCLMAFRAELKQEIFPFPSSGCLHDQWIGLIAEMNGKTRFIPEILVDYRRHEGNASSFTHLPFTRQMRDRLALCGNISRYRKKRRKKHE